MADRYASIKYFVIAWPAADAGSIFSSLPHTVVPHSLRAMQRYALR